MTYLVFLDSEENNDKVECLSKLSSIEDFLLNKRLLLFAKEVKRPQTTSDVWESGLCLEGCNNIKINLVNLHSQCRLKGCQFKW